MKAVDGLPIGKKIFKVPGEVLLPITDKLPELSFKYTEGCCQKGHTEKKTSRPPASDSD